MESRNTKKALPSRRWTVHRRATRLLSPAGCSRVRSALKKNGFFFSKVQNRQLSAVLIDFPQAPGFSMSVKLREDWTVVRVGRAEARMSTTLDVRPIRIRIKTGSGEGSGPWLSCPSGSDAGPGQDQDEGIECPPHQNLWFGQG